MHPLQSPRSSSTPFHLSKFQPGISRVFRCFCQKRRKIWVKLLGGDVLYLRTNFPAISRLPKCFQQNLATHCLNLGKPALYNSTSFKIAHFSINTTGGTKIQSTMYGGLQSKYGNDFCDFGLFPFLPKIIVP